MSGFRGLSLFLPPAYYLYKAASFMHQRDLFTL